MKLRPKNWDRFQHYKRRRPPWIKIHRDLLDDRMYLALPVASRALAPFFWLLASESEEGTFDASSEELVFRLRLPEDEITAGLIGLMQAGFLEPADDVASNLLAECEQSATPEERRDRGETEYVPAPKGALAPVGAHSSSGAVGGLLPLKNSGTGTLPVRTSGDPGSTSDVQGNEAKPKAKRAAQMPEGFDAELWRDWKTHRKTLLTPTALKGFEREAAKAVVSLEDAVRTSIERGWQGFKADWAAKEKPKSKVDLVDYCATHENGVHKNQKSRKL